MALDNTEIEQTLEKHGDRINNLEKDMEIVKIQLKNIDKKIGNVEVGISRMENTFLTQTTSMMQTMSQLVINTSNNNTQKEIAKTELESTKNQNKYSVIANVLKIIGSVLAGILLAKYGISIG